MAGFWLSTSQSENANYFKEELKKVGYNIGVSETPITPVILGDEKVTQTFSKKLIEHGIYAKPIVYPTVPLGTGRIRNMRIFLILPVPRGTVG